MNDNIQEVNRVAGYNNLLKGFWRIIQIVGKWSNYSEMKSFHVKLYFQKIHKRKEKRLSIGINTKSMSCKSFLKSGSKSVWKGIEILIWISGFSLFFYSKWKGCNYCPKAKLQSKPFGDKSALNIVVHSRIFFWTASNENQKFFCFFCSWYTLRVNMIWSSISKYVLKCSLKSV